METPNKSNQKNQSRVKSERAPLSDDNFSTPLRDERGASPGPTNEANVALTGWNSDDDNEATEAPLQDTSSQVGDQATPQRVSNHADIDTNPEAYDIPTPVEPNQEDQNEDVKFKIEEPAMLQLDFLDALSELDLARALDPQEPPMELLIKTEPVVPKSEPNVNEELEELAQVHNEILEKLKTKKNAKAAKKKRKKVKKHKRNRGHSESSESSRSSEPSLKRTRRHDNEYPRVRVPSAIVKPELTEPDYVPIQDSERTLKIINLDKLMQGEASAAAPPAPAPVLTIAEKRKLSVERVKAVLHSLHLKASKAPETEFLVVDTVRKLPHSGTFMGRATFENPSPLCNNFNVNYKFNSTTKSKIDISKWGLESLPEETAKLLRVTAIDVTRLMELQKNTKLTLHKLRLQQAAANPIVKTEDEDISSGLFRSLATQTDNRFANCTRDAGVQTETASRHDIFWLDSRFCETDLTQQHANVMLALKELCATAPSSTFWADTLYQSLRDALRIKREEVKQLAYKKSFSSNSSQRI